MRTVILAFLLLLPVVPAAHGERLIAAVSPMVVRIDQDFNGAEITVFGSVERDRATISRAEPYELAVIVRGPGETVVARRKDRVLGLWINKESRSFDIVPSFYAALATTSPLADLGTPEALRKYEVGLDNIVFSDRQSRHLLGGDHDEFRASVVRNLVQSGRYFEKPSGVEFLSDSLFRATVPLGPTAPVGTYKVTAVLFQGSIPLAEASAAIYVTKAGFEQWMHEMAFGRPLFYGLATVLTALLTGWLAGVLFRRD